MNKQINKQINSKYSLKIFFRSGVASWIKLISIFIFGILFECTAFVICASQRWWRKGKYYTPKHFLPGLGICRDWDFCNKKIYMQLMLLFYSFFTLSSGIYQTTIQSKLRRVLNLSVFIQNESGLYCSYSYCMQTLLIFQSLNSRPMYAILMNSTVKLFQIAYFDSQ